MCSGNGKRGNGANHATSREANSRCLGLIIDMELSSRHCRSQSGHASTLVFWMGAFFVVLMSQFQLLLAGVAADQQLQPITDLRSHALEPRGGRTHLGRHGSSRRMLQDAWENDEQGNFGNGDDGDNGSSFDDGDYGSSFDDSSYGSSLDDGGYGDYFDDGDYGDYFDYDDNDCSEGEAPNHPMQWETQGRKP